MGTEQCGVLISSFLPYSVGETSIAKPNTTPGIKLDATPIDKIKNIPTMASPASVNSGGKSTTKPQSSGGIISIKPTSIIRLTGKIPTKTYIKKRLSLIGGLTVAEALEISFYDESQKKERKYNRSGLTCDRRSGFIEIIAPDDSKNTYF